MTDIQRQILIIEDDADLASLVEIHLKDEGFGVHVSSEGRDGLLEATSGDYVLAILDIMLPGMDGWEICRRIRASRSSLPILVLTSRAEEIDKVLGLELGADDYMTKPFGVRELIARIRAILRRVEIDRHSTDTHVSEQLDFGDLVVDPLQRQVQVRGKTIELTAKEFDLLLLFAQHPGRAYNRQELLDKVWGYHYSGYSHTVNSHINRLRAKLEDDPSDPKFIKTVWGVGYRFVGQEETIS